VFLLLFTYFRVSRFFFSWSFRKGIPPKTLPRSCERPPFVLFWNLSLWDSSACWAFLLPVFPLFRATDRKSRRPFLFMPLILANFLHPFEFGDFLRVLNFCHVFNFSIASMIRWRPHLRSFPLSFMPSFLLSVLLSGELLRPFLMTFFGPFIVRLGD